MALRFPDSRCPICGEFLSDPVFATSGTFLATNDPLWPYCDACIHWSCYATWEHRERFAAAYVRSRIELETRDPYWARVFLDDFSFITINPIPAVSAAHVALFRTGTRIAIPLPEWPMFMCGVRTPRTAHPLEAAAWNEALPSIRHALPTEQSLLRVADWSGKKRLQAELRLREEERLATTAIYNESCRDLCRQLELTGLVCPHCHERTKRIRYYDKAPSGRSYFVCRLCARSFRLEDFVPLA